MCAGQPICHPASHWASLLPCPNVRSNSAFASIFKGLMNMAASQQSSYALGHSEQELERLAHQAQAFAPFTRQLFEQAGIGPGMRILDVGCGAGDVAFLAAELVGPNGEVVGADHSAAAVEWAVARAQEQGISNVKFLEGDPAVLEFEQQFDAVVGRLVLMYPDPVDAIGKLARHVRRGGLIHLSRI